MSNAFADFANQKWDQEIQPAITEYIKIPALSPHFDADWAANGNIDKAVEHIRSWCVKQPIEGLAVEVVKLGDRTPVLFMEIPAFKAKTDARPVLLYGHLDKQPEMQGWDADKGPWKPVLVGDRLYGRGGADDGYSAYASLTAIAALQAEGVPHRRCVVLIEACEESGSYDLPAYIDQLRERIGEPDLVICLDSGCGNYEQLWCTTSLRGLAAGILSVEVLEPPSGAEVGGVHSGDAGGVVPSTFRILRQLLDRIEDASTGEIKLDELNAEVPAQRESQAAVAAQVLGDMMWQKFPFKEGTRPMATGAEAILNRTFRPALEVVGLGDMPGLDAGNVLRSRTSAKLSIRIPPMVDGETATKAVKKALEADPPAGATVKFTPDQSATGWNAPDFSEWVLEALQAASRTYFDRDSAFMGEGGTIPFMGMLGEKFPDAQMVITGVLGPESNAHGPNEFLHLPTARKITACMSEVLKRHAERD